MHFQSGSNGTEVWTVEQHREQTPLKLSTENPDEDCSGRGERGREPDHVIGGWSVPAAGKPSRREKKIEKAAIRHCKLEQILAAKEEPYLGSVRRYTLDDFAFSGDWGPTTISFVGFHGKHRHGDCSKTIQVPKTEIVSLISLEDSQHKKTSAGHAHLSTGSIYRKLYHAFLAHKILNRKQTTSNRCTRLNLREPEGMNACNEDEGWGWGGSATEKAQRDLELLGIEVSHKTVSWNYQQFKESNPQGRYTCYRPTFLRWSWTMGEGSESEASPNEED